MSDTDPMLGDAHRFAPAAPEEEVVYGACSPGWHSAGPRERAIEQWISFMQDVGIERVCCLLTGEQLDASDTTVGRYRDAFGSENVRHTPVPDHRLADIDTLRDDILPFLDAAVEADEPVVVHGLAGIGRTGHVLAAWLVYGRDYTPERAIETVQTVGRDPFEPVEREGATRQDLLDQLAPVA